MSSPVSGSRYLSAVVTRRYIQKEGTTMEFRYVGFDFMSFTPLHPSY